MQHRECSAQHVLPGGSAITSHGVGSPARDTPPGAAARAKRPIQHRGEIQGEVDRRPQRSRRRAQARFSLACSGTLGQAIRFSCFCHWCQRRQYRTSEFIQNLTQEGNAQPSNASQQQRPIHSRHASSRSIRMLDATPGHKGMASSRTGGGPTGRRCRKRSRERCSSSAMATVGTRNPCKGGSRG